MENNKFQELIDKIKEVNNLTKELEPFGELKEVKTFGKGGGHITIDGKYVGERVLIIKLPK